MSRRRKETPAAAHSETVRVPVVAEELVVGKRTVETGRVRLTKKVREREETVDEPLLREDVTVERVLVNRPWEGGPPTPDPREDT